MNSEELELSLRTEFETYLKGVLAEMRQEATEFQTKIEAEFDKHRAQFDDAFQGFAARFDEKREFDDAFKGTVTEHLRLAKDEGAKITANAFAEAEDMQKAAAPAISYGELRDAINDICTKDSQSSILKTLVGHAANFAPRGAFFIIKSEQFAGWKVFGNEADESSEAIREIHFPVSSDTVLGDAVRSLSTSEAAFGRHDDDGTFLVPLQFGQPDRMYAIPLVARGRGVAVMYVDYGNEGVNVNLEALETLVRVAGMTVELLAASQTAKAEDREVGAADFEDTQHESAGDTHHVDEPAYSEPEPARSADFAFSDSVSMPGGFEEAPAYSDRYVPDQAAPEDYSTQVATDDYSTEDSFAHTQPMNDAALAEELSSYAPATEVPVEHQGYAETEEQTEAVPEAAPDLEDEAEGAMVFDSGGSIEPAAMDVSSPFTSSVEPFEPASAIGAGGMGQVVETAVEAVPGQSAHGRLSDRPVDLPIEVPDEERRLHNDARRFARLLVSEIKLYNEKKVLEGRQANDLYDRLREAIDRSREMYDKRVQQPVAEKFDYFHYELVNALADGDEVRLGNSYPGSTV